MKPLGTQIIVHRLAGLVFDREGGGGGGAGFFFGRRFVFQTFDMGDVVSQTF